MLPMLRQGLQTLPCMSYVLAPKYTMPQKQFVRSFATTTLIPERRFADPTYDDTFRKLFGTEANKEILISALNSFLGFTGNKEIQDVSINDAALERCKLIGDSPSIRGAIDVLCTTTSGQKIAVEMQRKKTKYFLAREQEYMTKLISGQVREGEGSRYHEKVLDTYIIVLSKENVFIGNTALKDQTLYEIDVIPTVQQTQEVYPGNKMHWKFFELGKFQKHPDSENITKDSPLKLQILDFLLTCSVQQNAPEDRDDIIKKSYIAMDQMTWEPDERAMHWKWVRNEEEGEELLLEREAKGRAEGEAKGRAEGKVKQLLDLLEFTQEVEKLAQKTGFTEEQIEQLLQEDKDISLAASKMLGFDLDLLGGTNLAGAAEFTEGDAGMGG